MTMFSRALSIFLAALCVSAADPKVGEKPDQQRIQGTWQFEKWLSGDEAREIPEGFRLVVTGDVMVLGKEKDKERDRMGFRYTIDPSKAPKQMDWIIELDPAKPIRQLAIYSLENDTLKICVTSAGKPRPADFEARKGDNRNLWALRRMVDAPK